MTKTSESRDNVDIIINHLQNSNLLPEKVIIPLIQTLSCEELVALLARYNSIKIHSPNFHSFLNLWSMSFLKREDMTINFLVEAFKILESLKYNNPKFIIRLAQLVNKNLKNFLEIEQLINVLHSFAKLQPYKDLAKLPEEKFLKIKQFVAQATEQVKANFHNSELPPAMLSKIIIALAKLGYKNEEFLGMWSEITLSKLNEFDNCDLVKNIESIALFDFYNEDLIRGTINRSIDLLRLGVFSQEQKIIIIYFYSLLHINNPEKENLNQELKTHIVQIINQINPEQIDIISEKRKLLFALDNLNLIMSSFTSNYIEIWAQQIKENIHNQVIISDSQQAILNSLKAIEQSGLDISVEAEKYLVRSLGPLDIVITFNYKEGRPFLVVQDDGLPHFMLSNTEEVNAKTKANSLILQRNNINFIRVNSYSKNFGTILEEIIERFPKIEFTATEETNGSIVTIEKPLKKPAISTKKQKKLPSSSYKHEKKSPTDEENIIEIIEKFKNENPSLYAETKTEIYSGVFSKLKHKEQKEHLRKAIKNQDYEFIFSIIKEYKNNKPIIALRKEFGEIVFEQIEFTLSQARDLNKRKIENSRNLDMYETYKLFYNENNSPCNNIEISPLIKINKLLLKEMSTELQQYLKNKNSNEKYKNIFDYAILAKDNELLVKTTDNINQINYADSLGIALKNIITPSLHYTLFYHNFAALEYLLSKIQFNINDQFLDKSLLLFDAVYALNTEATFYLLDKKGAQPNMLASLADIGYTLPLYIAVLAYFQKYDVKLGLGIPSKAFEDTEAEKIAKLLLNFGATTDFLIKDPSQENDTPENKMHFIFTAIQAKAVTIVEHAIKNNEIDINKKYKSFNDLYFTPLEFAKQLGADSILSLMAKKTYINTYSSPALEYVSDRTLDNDETDLDSLPDLIEEENASSLALSTVGEAKNDNNENEEEDDYNYISGCTIFTAITQTDTPETQNLFANLFSNHKNKELVVFNEPNHILAEEDKLLQHEERSWLNDPYINKLLLSIGPVDHQKINQLIKAKGGKPIKAIKYFYKLPDGGKGIYIENFLTKEKLANIKYPEHIEELILILQSIDYNPLQPIPYESPSHIQQNLSENEAEYLIFDENGFRFANEEEQNNFDGITVLDDLREITRNLEAIPFYKDESVEFIESNDNIMIENGWSCLGLFILIGLSKTFVLD